jgi:hypothetical protein
MTDIYIQKDPDKYQKLFENDEINPLCITQQGIYLKYNTNSKILISSLQKIFQIKTRMPGRKIRFSYISDSSHDRKEKSLILPRFGILYYLKHDCVKRVRLRNILDQINVNIRIVNCLKPFKPLENAKCKIELDNNQSLILNYLISNIYTEDMMKVGASGCILPMPPGSGKSYVGSVLISKLKMKSIVICHTRGVARGWKKIFSLYFKNVSIGQFYDSKKIDGDIVIAVINTIANLDLSSEITIKFHGSDGKLYDKTVKCFKYLAQFGLAIYDESQIYCNKMGVKAYQNLQTTCMLGLSATPNQRIDKFDPIAWWNLGPVIDLDDIKGYDWTETKFRGKICVKRYSGHPNFIEPVYNVTTGEVSTSGMTSQLSRDPYRLRLVVDEIYNLLRFGHKVLVFADRKSYLHTVQKAMCKYRAEYKMSEEGEALLENEDSCIITTDKEANDKLMTLTGGASDEKFTLAEINAKVIFTTYQYFGVGVSIDTLTSVVLLTPRKTGIHQNISRCFRGKNNAKGRRIIDIVDVKTSLGKQFSARKSVYKLQPSIGRELKIIEDEISYNSLEPMYVDQENEVGENNEENNNEENESDDDDDDEVDPDLNLFDQIEGAANVFVKN